MAANPYNGFTGPARGEAGRWYRARVRDGLVITSETCCTCTSTSYVNGHSEDYSAPYGPHIGAFDVCFICHMMLHCRYRNGRRFDEYCAHLEAGKYWEPQNRDFPGFAAKFLNPEYLPIEAAKDMTERPAVSMRDIGGGVYNPNAGGLSKWFPPYKKELPSGGQDALF